MQQNYPYEIITKPLSEKELAQLNPATLWPKQPAENGEAYVNGFVTHSELVRHHDYQIYTQKETNK